MNSYDAGGAPGVADEIAALLEGNRRWAATRIARDPDAFRVLAREHRPPFLLVGCCDARKPLDVVTQASPGHLFLHRNIANQIRPDDPAVGASLEFALGILGVRHLIVSGHTRCGGIQSALGPDPGGDLGLWLAPVRELARVSRTELDAAPDPTHRVDLLAERNVIVQLENALRHPAVRKRLRDPDRPLRLHGWMFHLETGRIESLDLPEARWREEGLLPA
jgi:carbonic anhydrase